MGTTNDALSINSTLPIGQSSSKPKSSSTVDTTNTTITTTTKSTASTPNRIPILGFGVYQSSGETCYAACRTALRSGYRHIDSAQYYANEAEVGRAVRDSGVPRREVYLTTKILGALGDEKDDVEKTYAALVRSVERMNCLEEGALGKGGKGGKDGRDAGQEAYVDLFLIHSPFSGETSRKTMWLALERVKADGLAREIGVSNYGRKYIEEMRAFASVFPPAVNQIEVCL